MGVPHTCHARGCSTAVRPTLLMCYRHWRMVPKPIQVRVYAHYKEGQCDLDPMPTKEWHEAADDAIKAVAAKERTP